MTGSCASARARALALGWLMVFSLLFLAGRVNAQGLRDPTIPPAEAGLSGSAPGGSVSGIAPGAMSIIVRDGRPHLVVATRLYAQGQKLGQARIERISETEVWLREDGVLRKVSLFAGIERRATTPVCAANASQGTHAARASRVSKAPNSSSPPSPVAPCADVQP